MEEDGKIVGKGFASDDSDEVRRGKVCVTPMGRGRGKGKNEEEDGKIVGKEFACDD